MNYDHVDSFSVPEWAVSAIEYGDYSDLESDEIEQVRSFAEKYPSNRFYIEWGSYPYFSKRPAFGIPTMCTDAVIWEKVELLEEIGK